MTGQYEALRDPQIYDKSDHLNFSLINITVKIFTRLHSSKYFFFFKARDVTELKSNLQGQGIFLTQVYSAVNLLPLPL